MFWTGEGVVEDEKTWKSYVGVCEGVVPSWDGGGKADRGDVTRNLEKFG